MLGKGKNRAKNLVTVGEGIGLPEKDFIQVSRCVRPLWRTGQIWVVSCLDQAANVCKRPAFYLILSLDIRSPKMN